MQSAPSKQSPIAFCTNGCFCIPAFCSAATQRMHPEPPHWHGDCVVSQTKPILQRGKRVLVEPASLTLAYESYFAWTSSPLFRPCIIGGEGILYTFNHTLPQRILQHELWSVNINIAQSSTYQVLEKAVKQGRLAVGQGPGWLLCNKVT